ncbi:MAG: carbon-nitrogen hydrolase family protein [Acidimicrobiia bacterium]
MRIAAYQAPYLPFGSLEAVDLIRDQLVVCEAQRVEILCCPEAILGGLAHESAGQSPEEVALGVDNGELTQVVAPLLDSSVTLIVGFTERDEVGNLFNAAALIVDGQVTAIHRKSYPGYRTVIQAGSELPVFRQCSTPFGIVICNDLWYPEPVRILAASGAAIVFVPTNSGHARAVSKSFRARGENLPLARAVDNTTTIVVADIAGTEDGRVTPGFSAILDPDGIVLGRAEPMRPGLVIAEVEPTRRAFDPRGWDGHTNMSVRKQFLDIGR